jgi:hypothetical protein
MRDELAPRLRAVLQELALADNPVRLVAVRSWGSEVEAEFRYDRKLFYEPRDGGYRIRYCAFRRLAFATTNLTPSGDWHSIPGDRLSMTEIFLPFGLGRYELSIGVGQWARIKTILHELSEDDRAEQAHLEGLFGPPGWGLVLPTSCQAVWGTDRELFLATEKDESLYVRRQDGRWQYQGQCPNGSLLTSDDWKLYCTTWGAVYSRPIDRPDQPWQEVCREFPPREKDSITASLHAAHGRLMVTVWEHGVLKLWSRRLSDPNAEWSLHLQAPGAHSWIVVGDRLYATFDDRLKSRPLDDPTADWRTEGPSGPDGARGVFRLDGAFYTSGTDGQIYSRPLAAGPDVGWRVVGRVQEPARDVVEHAGP